MRKTEETKDRGIYRLRDGWRFHQGDIPFPVVSGHKHSYDNAKTGTAAGAASPFYDDTRWESVRVPHDWAVARPIDPGANLSQGFRRGGAGWYRRYFRMPESWRDRYIELAFGGITTHAAVWLNGALLHRSFSGTVPFRVEIGPFGGFGDQANVLAVRVDADAREGWWYEGAGIYRDVTLHVRPALHLVSDGHVVRPVRREAGRWSVRIEAEIRNAGSRAQAGRLMLELDDPDGTVIATGEQSVRLAAQGRGTTRLQFEVDHPGLWSPENPALYRVRLELVGEDGMTDRREVRTGFRTGVFDPARGFLLNGEPYKIKGVCCHQDHAGVGVAVPRSLLGYRLKLLKEMGVNAYRCAHHPPDEALLELCDALGLLVLDEARVFSSADFALRELETLVRRDRNHPCVFLWSLGNEEPLQSTRAGVEIARRMRALVRELDPGRPVTAAMNGGLFAEQNLAEAVDVVGINYQPGLYDRYHAAHPERCLLSTEDGSGVMSRGETRTDIPRGLVAAYDEITMPWGATCGASWTAIARRPFLAGGFHWTGFDYHGEPAPAQWPSASSFFGILDLCGFPKTAYYIKKAHWKPAGRTLFVFPHWNWPGREGEPIRVVAVTNAVRVSLSLNGLAQGERTVEPDAPAEWLVPYQPGCLEAHAAWPDGRTQSRRIETTGPACRIRLLPDRDFLLGDGDDTMPVRVAALDDAGREVPTASDAIRFQVEGPAVVAGTGNGDPNDHEPETAPARRLYHGLAQVLIRHDCRADRPATRVVRLTAEAQGLAPASLELKVRPAAPGTPAWPSAEPALRLASWRLSPFSTERPDPHATISEDDMNSWEPFTAGSAVPMPAGCRALLRTTFRTPGPVAAKGWVIVFPAFAMACECWHNGVRREWEPTDDGKGMRLAIPPCETTHTLVLALHARSESPLRMPFAPTLTPATAQAGISAAPGT